MGRRAKLVVVVLIACLLTISLAYTLLSQNQEKKEEQAKPTKPAKPKAKREKKFAIEIVGVEETGTLSRKITARLTNKDGYAKNVVVTLELLLDGERIKINGKEELTLSVGDIKPNESVEKTVELSVGFFDGLKIKSKGYVNAKLVIKWDGGREVFRKKVQLSY